MYLPFIFSFSLLFIFYFFVRKLSSNFFSCFPAFLWPFLPLFHAVIYYPIRVSHFFTSRHFGSAFKHDFPHIFSLVSIHCCNYHSIFFLPLFQCPLSSLPVHFSLKFFSLLAFTRRIKERRVWLLLFLTENQLLWRIWHSPLMYGKVECPIKTGYFSI